MIRKNIKKNTAFVNTSFGYVNAKNIYKKLGYSDFVRASKDINFKSGILPKNIISAGHKVFNRHKGLTNIGLKVGGYLLLQGIDNLSPNNLHASNSQIPLITSTSSSGRSVSRIFNISCHIGYPDKKSASYLKLPNFKLIKKDIFNTETDLHNMQRNHLITKCGFSQKKFVFLKKTYITPAVIKALYSEAFRVLDTESQQYDISLRKAAISGDRSDLPELTEAKLFGGLNCSQLRFKISNELYFYNLGVRIHLIKITNPKISLKRMLKNVFHKTINTATASTDIENYAHRIGFKSQLTPIMENGNTSFQINTHVAVNLSSSSFFVNNCKIIKTITRNLSAGDILNANIEEMYGFINLTNLYSSLKSSFISEDSPLGFVICIEVVGDSRARVVSTRNEDIMHIGYSPTRTLLQSKFTLKYLATHSISGPDNPLIYREKVQDNENDPQEIISSFSESIAKYFCPDRHDEIMNIDYEKLLLFGMSAKKKNLSYKLVYDPGILDQTNDLREAVQGITDNFKRFNQDTNNVNADDADFVYRGSNNSTSNADSFLDDLERKVQRSQEEEEDEDEDEEITYDDQEI